MTKSKSLKADRWAATTFGVVAIFGSVAIIAGVTHTVATTGAQQKFEAAEMLEANQAAIATCKEAAADQLVSCLSNELRKADSNSLARQTLYSQQETTRWAGWAVLVSALSVGTAIVGTWFVRLNLQATLRALDQNLFMTDTMIEQNRQTERGHRAWLSVELVSLGPVRFDEGRYRLEYILKLENHGQLPALGVTSTAIILPNWKEGSQNAFDSFKREAASAKKHYTKAVPPGSTLAEPVPGLAIETAGLGDDGLWPDKSIPTMLIGVTYLSPGSSEEFITAVQVVAGTSFAKRQGSGEVNLTIGTLKTFMT